jgi:hypothetical protein
LILKETQCIYYGEFVKLIFNNEREWSKIFEGYLNWLLKELDSNSWKWKIFLKGL